MARVPVNHHGSRHGSRHAVGSSLSTVDRAKAARKKKPYKVVMEVVTQEKKKLRSVMAYSAESPPGYTFVPLGHPELTEYCKERCRQRNLEAHIVTAQPKARKNSDPEKDNDHAPRIDTQRIGHHFPNQIIDEACDVLGYIWRNGTFHKSSRNYEETRLARTLRDYGHRMRLHGRPMTEKETKDQIRGAILEVFPKIPSSDLDGVVSHAFEEGTNRVGNAKDLTLARRVQLAVGAYIRHQYTNYDTILKTGGTWPEARSQVQSITYGKLKEWRDEGDAGNELEETFREIIVLDDDESDDESETDDTSFDGSEASMEIISSQATAGELRPNNPADMFSLDVRPVGHRRRMIYLEPAHRGVISVPGSPRPLVRVPAQPSYMQQVPLSHNYPSIPHIKRQTEVRGVRPAPRAGLVQASDGKWYNLEPIDEPGLVPTRAAEYASHTVEYPPPPSSVFHHSNGRVQSPRQVDSQDTHGMRSAHLGNSGRSSREEIVLPSIEQETGIVVSPRRYPEGLIPIDDHGSAPMGSHHPIVHTPKRKAFAPIIREDPRPYEPQHKRLRPLDHSAPLPPPPPQSILNRSHTRLPLDDTYNRSGRQLSHGPAPPRIDVDLNSSPYRRSDRDRLFDTDPSHTYALRGRPYVSNSYGAQANRVLAYAERSAPQYDHFEPVNRQIRYSAAPSEYRNRSGFY
ncbi:hypothetical protein BU24DRAFT_419573 [Aaosphaeria arxii CBS 175.79]|uniref:DUF2293 domain-containing protein n=1 Tax=Aaosphaeria arxii CBS 175.79 TaxID=1450172 RepID=A0A6A5Y357_9PLEO|nr:uncharacterized protein BU24DRAFT_419573 [Aaosphaeria arxii CBS 175.79]KAF2019965.1 hypothetical protein BU24DRAFT_419573 [Aaosphaeria arxii CBS 175.79]